jgi:hypothetical protein
MCKHCSPSNTGTGDPPARYEKPINYGRLPSELSPPKRDNPASDSDASLDFLDLGPECACVHQANLVFVLSFRTPNLSEKNWMVSAQVGASTSDGSVSYKTCSSAEFRSVQRRDLFPRSSSQQLTKAVKWASDDNCFVRIDKCHLRFAGSTPADPDAHLHKSSRCMTGFPSFNLSLLTEVGNV